MPAALSAIRGLALIGVVLAVVAVPIGAVLRAISVPGDRGDNGLGDIIATTLGAVLLIGGGAALILGGGLAVLARRALAAHAEIAGSRRTRRPDLHDPPPVTARVAVLEAAVDRPPVSGR